MKWFSTTMSVVFIVVVLAGALAYLTRPKSVTPPQVACTMEAKLCPDGSSVGRQGPNCEFPACPPVVTQTEKSAKISERVLINGVYVTPLKVMEDSRCPVDVQCIQAGRTTLNTKLEMFDGSQTKELVFTAGSFQTLFAGKEITFKSVSPDKHSKQTIASTDYVFTFDVTDSSAPIPDNSKFITVTAPKDNATVDSPLTITGQAVGNWYFEASFPVKLLDANGVEIASTPAAAQGDWMTDSFVPFTATLVFEKPATATGTLVLEKDNPSGDPANDKSISIPVNFAE